ncbi:MAG: class I SAM-dependent methyltransferase [Chloroflexota bacterium]
MDRSGNRTSRGNQTSVNGSATQRSKLFPARSIDATDPDSGQHRRQVQAYFDRAGPAWTEVYRERTVWGEIHQLRRALALARVDELNLAAESRVLEVGAGTGLLAIDLARRGFTVHSLDVSDAMVELAESQARASGFIDQIEVRKGDVHCLAYDSGSFDLVTMLGVLPFLDSPEAALGEIARVLKPDAHVLLTSDNSSRLTFLFDPRFWPVLKAPRELVKRFVGRKGEFPFSTHAFRQRDLIQLLNSADLDIQRVDGFGYGPFTLLGRQVVPDRLGILLQQRLQQYADGGTSIVRSAASQHLVLAARA